MRQLSRAVDWIYSLTGGDLCRTRWVTCLAKDLDLLKIVYGFNSGTEVSFI